MVEWQVNISKLNLFSLEYGDGWFKTCVNVTNWLFRRGNEVRVILEPLENPTNWALFAREKYS